MKMDRVERGLAVVIVVLLVLVVAISVSAIRSSARFVQTCERRGGTVRDTGDVYYIMVGKIMMPAHNQGCYQ